MLQHACSTVSEPCSPTPRLGAISLGMFPALAFARGWGLSTSSVHFRSQLKFLEEVFVPERIPLREPLQKGVHLVCSGYRFVRGGGAGESVIGPSLVRSGQVLIEISKYSNA